MLLCQWDKRRVYELSNSDNHSGQYYWPEKKNPMGTVAEGEGDAVAILNRNEPAFYCVPPKLYAYYRELAEDAELNAVADERMKTRKLWRLTRWPMNWLLTVEHWRNGRNSATPSVNNSKETGRTVENPRVPAARLHGHADRYKIKLRASGYRLVYQVIDEKVVLLVIAVGRRESSEVYQIADLR